MFQYTVQNSKSMTSAAPVSGEADRVDRPAASAAPVPRPGRCHTRTRSVIRIDTIRIKAYTRCVSTSELIFISVAARLLDMHPQTLRKYERLGLVRPARTLGSMRLYSTEEIERLRFIKRLVEDEGVNLAGVQHLLAIAESMQRIRPLMDDRVLQQDATRRRRLLRELAQLNTRLGLDEV
jgi:MerR family transcriptional regulator, heat shock protein HspR